MLKEIARQHGECQSDPLELVDGIYWHKQDKIFDPCDCRRGNWKSSCERVQVLLPSKSVGANRHPKPFDYMKGAVIFGRSRRIQWMYPNEGEPIEGEESDSEQEEEESEFHDSGIGEISSSTSGVGTSTSSNSSPLAVSSETSEINKTNEDTMSGGILHHDSPNVINLTDSNLSKQNLVNRNAVSCSGSVGKERPKSFQIISRGVKRTLEKMRENDTSDAL